MKKRMIKSQIIKKILKIVSAALIIYGITFTLVFIADYPGGTTSVTSSIKTIDPSTAISSISGSASETIILAPNLEQPFFSKSFIPPISGYGLQLSFSNKVNLIDTDDHIPIAIYKNGSSYSYFYFSEPNIPHPSFIANKEKMRTPPSLDSHDVVAHRDGTFTYIQYLDDYDDGAMHLGLSRVNKEGKPQWLWNSSMYISKTDYVQAHTISAPFFSNSSLKEKLKNLRTAYSRQVFNFLGKNNFKHIKDYHFFLGMRMIPIFDKTINLVDYVHANSIQYLQDEQYLLVTARNLDALFIIEVKTGSIIWSLGGPYSRFTEKRPIGDPRGGFSHPHSARIYKNKLYLFDNSNSFPNLPSRAVVYTFDIQNPQSSRFLFEYLEPYGRRRLTMGSIQPLDEDRILIGWGGVPIGPDRSQPSAAASIVSMKNKNTEWQLNFKPGWTSYQALIGN